MTRPTRADIGIAVLLFVGALVVYDAAGVSHAGGDTTWSVHEAWSVLTDGDIDLVEYRPLIDERRPPFWRARGDRILYGYPWGGSILNAPVVAAWSVVAEVQGAPIGETLAAEIPTPELEGDIAASISALAVAVLYLWVRRRTDRAISLALASTFAFATSMLSSVSRALWNVGPALLMVLGVLFLVDEHVRGASRRRLVAATIGLGVVPVWIYATRPSAAVVGVVALWIVARHRLRHLPLLAVAGTASLLVVRMVNDATWGPGGHPYYARRTSDPDFDFEALAANLVSPARGLLIWSPFLVLAIVGVVVARRHPPGPLVAAYVAPFVVWIAAHLVLISTMEKIWWAGFSTGPRLMADALPAWFLLMIPAAEWLRALPRHRSAALALVASMVLVSGAIHLHAATDFDVHLWNAGDDIEPRIWEWSDPPFLR